MRPLALAALLAAQPLAAQTSADSLPVPLPTVSVTATRSLLEGSALPVTVSVFSRAALRDAGITQVADVLRLVPGATVLSNGSFGSQASLFFRGGESDYVLVLVDGVPVNAPGGAFSFGALTLDHIERVEVVRGPASVLYGSEAVTGVVQIFTRQGSGPARLSVLAGAGSYGTSRIEAGLAGGGGALGWSLGATRYETDGILDFNSQHRNATYSGALRWAGERASLAASLRVTDNVFHYPTNSSGEVVDSNAYTTEDRVIAAIETGVRLSRRFEVRARATHSAADNRTRDLPDFASDPNSFVADADVTRDGLELRAIIALGSVHTLTAALDRTRDREVSASLSNSEFGPFESELRANRTNVGAALQLAGRASFGTNYVAGFRHDDNSEFGTFTTARIGAAHQLGSATTVRASYGTAFKAPTFFENFATGFVRGNPDLSPERSTAFEAGLHQAFGGGRLAVGATYFTQLFRDLIQYDGSVGAGEPNYRNLAGASADGFELEAAWRVGPSLSIRGSTTWLDTEVTDAGAAEGPSADFVEGARLLRRPSRLASAGLNYTGRRGVRLGAIVTHTGERDDRDFSTFPATPVVLDAFTRLDFSAVVPVGRSPTRVDRSGRVRSLALVLKVENALDEEYAQVLGFRSPGRTLFAGVRIGD